MNKLYAVDAVNYLFRSYYAIGPMTNDQGQSTGALYGFIRSIQKLIKDFSISHLVAVFDGPDNKQSRQTVYADYKIHRKKAPEDLYPQLEWAQQWCKWAGIPTLCFEGVEADDAIAAVASWASKIGTVSYLCSSDKDLMQLINDRIFMLHAHKDNLLIDKEKVKELFGVRPDQMLDYLAIVGDASDNIPGIAGFGPKTAAALLEEFGTLDYLLSHPEKIKGEKKQEILRTQKKEALMSRQLATLDTQVDIPKEIAFYHLQEPNRPKLIEFYHQMKFHSLLRELDAGLVLKKEGKWHTDKQHYHLVDDATSLRKLFDRLNKETQVCIDIKTIDPSPITAQLLGVGFCVEPGEASYVPCNGQLGNAPVLAALKDFFLQTNCSFYGHNLKFALHVLKNSGIALRKISFDTLLASYLLNPQKRDHRLDELVLEKFKKVKIGMTSLIEKGKEHISMRDLPCEKVSAYCCEEADYTTRLKELFEEELKEKKLDHLFTEIELPLLSILADMEQTGIFLDTEQLNKLGKRLISDLEILRQKIFEEVGEEFNLNSPKQLSEILFHKLGMKQPSRKKTTFSTGADVLEQLAEDHPVAYKILEYRGLEKLRSTYVEALPRAVDPKTQRIHCTFNQSITATGRLSSQDPNLQNIPVRTKEGLSIRACFKPEKKEWSYLGGDYSQIELRILAHFSGDPELVRAFHSGQDIHVHTASLVYDIPPAMVTSEMRSLAKTVNFGIIYGQGAFGLSRQLHISVKEASEFIQKYFKRYPKVLEYLEECKEAARKTGLATTLMGRQRPIPEMTNKNPSIRAAAERLAVNTPLQGTAADLIKMAMIAIDRSLREKQLQGKMILQIHDELIFEAPDEEIPILKLLVKEKMEQVLQLKVPIEVHIAVGKNWADC